MVLSVCIPVYNSDVKVLALAISKQIAINNFPVEIIVLDDASSPEIELINRNSLEEITNTRYFSLPENMGRSVIRNRFIDLAHGDFVLFIDGDSHVISEDFIGNYLQTIQLNSGDLIFGGSVYQNKSPSRDKYLRWKYSICRESKSVRDRANSHYGFKTNNFCIKKAVLKEYPFDERVRGYGHEDTLFGFVLLQNNIKIVHIDNPVLNSCLDSNPIFLEKTQQSIQNLWFIHEEIQPNIDFINHVRLLKTYYNVKKYRAIPLLRFVNYLVGKSNEHFLKSGWFTLRMFDFYKLAMLVNWTDKKGK
jgi:glycosyltransferase involved in cell wall biosynthesis